MKVSTEVDKSCLRLRKSEKSFEDVPLLDEELNDYNVIINFEILKQFLYVDLLYVQNVYQRTLNLEMIYHLAWVMLIKSTLLVETVVIKNPHIDQNNDKKYQKVKYVENLILT